MLARAFHEDPAWTWILPSPRRRARTLPGLFRTAIAVTMSGGLVDTTAGVVQGLALWIPPGDAVLAVNRAAARTMLTVPLRLRSAFGRFRTYTEWNYELQRRAHPGPTLFLSGLGVDPAYQGRGVGGALLEAGLARDSQTTAVLLTNSERNLPFYESHGFETVLEERTPDGGPLTWAMRRRPR